MREAEKLLTAKNQDGALRNASQRVVYMTAIPRLIEWMTASITFVSLYFG
jgi:hypothetical protein